MTNQVHEYVSSVAELVTECRGAEMKIVKARIQQATLSKPIAVTFSSCEGKLKNRTTTPAKTLLEEESTPSTGKVCHKRVVLFFCAKPDDIPVEVDLLPYMKLGLARESTSSPPNSKAGKNSIRRIGERFHDFPMLSLRDAWLKWHRLELSPQA